MSHYPKLEWHKVETLEDGWTNYGGANASAAFYRDNRNRVHLRGLIKGGVPRIDDPRHSKLFDLPEEYRPHYEILLPIAIHVHPNSPQAHAGTIWVKPNGEVWAIRWDKEWISLDGAYFFTDS